MYSPSEELSSISFDKIIGGALNAVISAQSESSLTTVNFVKNVGFKLNEKGEATDPIFVSFNYPKEIAPYSPPREGYDTLIVSQGGAGYSKENITTCKLGGKEVNIIFDFDSKGSIQSAQLENPTLSDIPGGTELVVEVANPDGITPCSIKLQKVAAIEAKPAVYQDMQLKVPILTMMPIPFIRVQHTDLDFNVKINSMTNTTESDSSKKEFGGNLNASYKGFGFKAGLSLNASMSSQKKKSSTEDIKKEFSLNIKVHAIQDEMPTGISRILDILEESIVPHVAEVK